QYKGRLPYPVPGKIVVSFGNQYNAALGTTTRNTGVDIQSREGAEVHSVAKGKVSLISWLRRLGNTVIIDHGEGFYTVYAHLSEIFVSVDQHVAAGQTIANLDESDEGKAVLHFEIYKDREAVDPAGWLR
ncbi:MAG TPA: peptidoglycan DD-metalloendopeptidase family protein, partial [bacterium]|nr:peptidoglycan DD-metalloendopeptidase family protein [bacterium]